MTEKSMVAKFPGTCIGCKQPFVVGTKILWMKGAGAKHEVPTECGSQTSARVSQPMPAVTIDAIAIVQMINGMQAKGRKWPKLRFLAPNGGEMRLSVSGGYSKVPGSVQVKVNGDWLGRLEPSGNVFGKRLTEDQAMLHVLRRIAVDPVSMAKEYGAAMCQCTVCGKALKDEGSTEVGYGPKCAELMGWPHQSKGKPPLKQMAVAS